MFAGTDIMTWVGLGAVVVAFFAITFALNLSLREGATATRWKAKANDLDRKLGSYDAIMGAYPGLIMVWEESVHTADNGWGDPKVLGSPAALASIMRFADPGPSNNLARRILDGIADLNTIAESTDSRPLRQYIAGLRTKGDSFSISIVLPEGNVIEADGRVAGRQVVLWLEDASIRGEDEKTAISRFENSRITSETDPIAFIEMMSRAPFPLWRMNSGGRINWVNDAYVEAVGATDVRDVTKNQIHLDHQANEDAQTVLSEQRQKDSTRHMVLGGERRATAISLFPVNGGLAGIAVDANETDELRVQLGQQVAAHDKLLNSMDEAVVIFGSDKKARFENEAFRHMFGLNEDWSRDQPSHGEWLDHMRERGQIPAQPDHGKWKSEELSLYTEWPSEMPPALWHLHDGRTLRLVRMRDPQGGIALMFSDMTDRIDMEGRLGTLINVQRATLDKLSEGIAVFGTDGRLKIHNNAFARMWSLSEEDLKEAPRFSSIIDLCLPLYHDKLFWNDLKARATDPNPEVRRQVEGEIRRSDDKMLTWLSKPLPDGATLIAWDDVTSARRTEAALIERAEALEEADRMKSEFVGHVSYQLRTPLTTISGYADFLQNGGAGEMNDKQSEYVFAIQSASEDLAKIIDDILDIAAIEANVLDLDLGDVDVYDVLSHALDYVATKAEDTKISMELDCPQDIGKIRADETRIKQVVYNLLSNALRFTKPGGLIQLGGQRAPGGGVRIWVKDDGVGIPSDRQSQVFESFESSRGGAGLGLALVQRFVERHGGWVELESDEGAGTHVTCYLPKEAAPDAGHPELFEG
ncbi:sensor protein DivL [Litorimonas cladophorae]|uniref:histidine kinase n=2 Tax=Litorimonas cladophorae TaxID=1220491 RepID=A0A918KR37_9PROT|nr:sensor protein DivL [Litorimonas cladophorae]